VVESQRIFAQTAGVEYFCQVVVLGDSIIEHMISPKFGLFFDNHTMASCLVIGLLITGAADKTAPLIGVPRMLSELKMQFDIINTRADFGKYRLLILPDDASLTPETACDRTRRGIFVGECSGDVRLSVGSVQVNVSNGNARGNPC
jgi:hypothetical protein